MKKKKQKEVKESRWFGEKNEEKSESNASQSDALNEKMVTEWWFLYNDRW